MTVMTLTPPTSSTATRTLAQVDAAALRMYDAEFALHAARQTGVDSWIAAAYEKLHAAIAEHTAALHGSAFADHPTAA
jgi:hypothetical protein